MLYPARQVEYRVAPSANAPATSATTYRYVPEERDRSRELSESLGVPVRIDRGHLVMWSYSRDPNGAVSSDTAIACAPDGKCPTPPPPPVVAGLPSAAEAEAKARRLLDDAGLDAGRVVDSGDRPGITRTVSLAPELAGVEVVGAATSFTFGEHGRLESANGWLGRFERVGDYPLVDLGEAVERLRSGFGAGYARDGIATMEAQADPGGGASGSSPGSGAPEPAPRPDQPPETVTTLPPEVIEITGAGVVLHVVYPSCPGDPVYAVPAFAFEPERAGSVIAVRDDDLTDEPKERPRRGAPADPCPGVKPEPEPLPPSRGQTEPAPPSKDSP